jgi:hypothetical protein
LLLLWLARDPPVLVLLPRVLAPCCCRWLNDACCFKPCERLLLLPEPTCSCKRCSLAVGSLSCCCSLCRAAPFCACFWRLQCTKH